MEFLRPWVLVLTPLIAVPIIIHLFGRRARRIAKFSWVYLLKIAKTEGIRKQRPFEILLMVLRTIVFAALIFGFAEPVMVKGLRDIRDVYIDISYSMSPFLDEARGLIERIRDASPAVRVHFFSNKLYSGLERPVKTYLSTDIGLVSGNSLVFTDLQRTMLRGASKAKGILIVTPDRGIDNCAITSLEPGEPFLTVGMNVGIRIKIENFGDRPFQGRLEILDGGDRVGGWDVVLDRGESSEFDGKFNLSSGEIVAQLTPEDELEADNRRFAFLPKVDSIRVLIVGSNRYLEAALSPKFVHTPFLLSSVSKLRTYGQINDADMAVFLGNPNPIEARLLRQAIKDGKGVVVVLSPDSIDTSGMEVLGVKVGRQITGAKLGNAVVSKGWEILNGTPILKSDEGITLAARIDNLAVIGFPFEPLSSDFVYVPDFVPFVQTLFLELCQQVVVKYVFPGEIVNFPVRSADVELKVIDPSGHVVKAIPTPTNGGWSVKLDMFEEPGFYKIFDRDRLVGVVVVNIDPRESDTRPASKDELRSSLGSFEVVKLGRESGRPLKPILLEIAAIALLLEMVVVFVAERKSKAG